MQIIRNLNKIKNALPRLVLTIGNFDGMHLGHMAIINEIKKIAKEKNISSAILTFEPHPVTLFQPDRAKDFRINGLAQKLKIFKEQQIDYVIILPFNQNLANIEAYDFIQKILVKSLNVKSLVIGYDFIFGKNREGNFSLLEKESKNFDFARRFDLMEISALKKSQEICSSSFIRKLLKDGRVVESNQFLGRNFTITGIVNEGRKLARQMGFPTANLIAKPHIIKPKFGVYKTLTFIPHLNQKFPSITNFGIKPTVQEEKIPLYETHIPNFNQDLYGKKIEVEFIDFVREEKKFASLEGLKRQILDDLEILKRV
jgi:riboflavin kinase/FMN adenylyltransferase